MGWTAEGSAAQPPASGNHQASQGGGKAEGPLRTRKARHTPRFFPHANPARETQAQYHAGKPQQQPICITSCSRPSVLFRNLVESHAWSPHQPAAQHWHQARLGGPGQGTKPQAKQNNAPPPRIFFFFFVLFERERERERAYCFLGNVEDGKAIRREFKFADFYRSMSFVNAVAHIANVEDHHPDIECGWGYARIRYQTHAIGGLHENDFICAAKIDALGMA